MLNSTSLEAAKYDVLSLSGQICESYLEIYVCVIFLVVKNVNLLKNCSYVASLDTLSCTFIINNIRSFYKGRSIARLLRRTLAHLLSYFGNFSLCFVTLKI